MNKKEVKIQVPRGRAYINWFGKKAPDTIEYFPAQLVEKTEGSEALKEPNFEVLQNNWHNLIFHGDNKECLSNLLTNGFRGKVDLIYIDPPFDSGADYVRKVELRGTKKKLEGEEQSLYEQVQYNDIWKNDSYLQFMYERLVLLRELLSDEGSIYLHCDWHKSHHLRFLLDEVFGAENFVNEIVWCYRSGGASKENSLARKHDLVIHYKKTDYFKIKTFKERQYLEKSFMDSKQDDKGRYYVDTILRDIFTDVINIINEDGKIKSYNTRAVLNLSSEREDYPTQKPEGLLELLIELATNEGSIVLDCFMGSGTTGAVAQKLGRRWIGVDCNKGSIQTTIKRLQKIVNAEKKDLLNQEKTSSKILHYKVNNYDFREINNIQDVIVQKYGLTKSSDEYFHFKKGEKFVKIINLQRPLTPLDVSQIIEKALERGSDEDVLVYCSGTQDDLRIEEIKNQHNKMREGTNKIIITDIQKDGIMQEKPPEFEIDIIRNGNTAEVEIKNYISNQILQKFNLTKDLFSLEIQDFKSQIDYVLIDVNYNGDTFTTHFSDIPKRKKDLIDGKYKLEAKGKIAVKIVSMLGEEVLFVE